MIENANSYAKVLDSNRIYSNFSFNGFTTAAKLLRTSPSTQKKKGWPLYEKLIPLYCFTERYQVANLKKTHHSQNTRPRSCRYSRRARMGRTPFEGHLAPHQLRLWTSKINGRLVGLANREELFFAQLPRKSCCWKSLR